MKDIEVLCYPSSASASEECSGHVVVSGSYGGEYNAWHAAKWGIRGVILNDAGVGKDDAGINGLPYLDIIGLPAATADAQTCHIADAEHMLEHGVISHVNQSAIHLGCKVGQTVRDCAALMQKGEIIDQMPPEINGGKRYVISEVPGQPRVICVDAAPMLDEADAGAIAVTGSHAAMFRGQPDGLIAAELTAVFFSDAGVGLDQAGITRLSHLDERNMIAGAASAASGSIGNSRSIYQTGVLSHCNKAARAAGAQPGMAVREFIDMLLAASKA